MSLILGMEVENKAANFLAKQGLRLLKKNFRCRWGEIDLIMLDKRHLIFVEVRARASMNYGGAIASITKAKQLKIIKTANYYLTANNCYEQYAVRFDVVSIEGKMMQMEWIKNAFDAS